MAKVLVVGGAGYVGSSVSAWLIDHGHEVWVLDDLSRGHRDFVLGSGFTHARAGDRKTVRALLSEQSFDCVMHFAAFALVSESVEKPEIYQENNVEQTRSLLEEMLDAGVSRFVFSSTCAIFGDPGSENIHEDLPKNPVNPYGRTKLEAERIMAELAERRGLQSIALRYFNAAGAERALRVGERHDPETHLIPNVLKAAISGTPVPVMGTDYPTADGTCVRDYIHVSDLASGHMAAMERLIGLPDRTGGFEAFNLGSERGYSVREVIEACGEVLGRPVPFVEKPRRAGDPPRLVADSSRAKERLEFSIQHDLGAIIRSAWDWERKQGAR